MANLLSRNNLQTALVLTAAADPRFATAVAFLVLVFAFLVMFALTFVGGTRRPAAPEHHRTARHRGGNQMTTEVAAAVRSGVRVELQDLRRSFGDVHALNGMNLDITPGELVVLLGPSGCGKTTALRVLAGLEDADAGRVVVDGKDISSVPTSKRDMGMVFQAYSLFPHLTALDNVAFGLRLRGKSAGERRRIAGEYLELVGLDHHADRYAHQMSGGQQQRVALARALAIQPTVLLLDEPLSALDAKVRVQLRDEIRRIQLEVGITTLFVTHDQEEALAVADRVGVMSGGRIEQIDVPEEIYSKPRTAFVAAFIGVTNRVTAIAEGDVALVLGSRVPLLPGSPSSGTVTALVRPESIRMEPLADSAEGAQATVATTSFLGAHGRVQARLDDGTLLLAQMPVSQLTALGIGDRVQVSVAPTPVPGGRELTGRLTLVPTTSDQPGADPTVLLDLAVRAAHAAGQELLRRYGHVEGLSTKSSATDLVSDADREAEALLVRMLGAERPGDGIIGEEGANRPSDTGITWVIDPLDGTVNYLYQLGGFSVSVAAEDGDGGLVGVVHDPLAGRTVTATRGGGAFEGPRRLAVNDPVALDRAMLGTGFGYSSRRRELQGAIIGALLPRIRDIRRMGSAALDLCAVATGRLDAFYEEGIQHWDVAAGGLIATEAGAVVSSVILTDADTGCLAAGPALHPVLCDALQRCASAGAGAPSTR